MVLLEQLGNLRFNQNDFILVIPMALVGIVAMSTLPCRTRIAHYSLEACGAVAGAMVAITLMGGLAAML